MEWCGWCGEPRCDGPHDECKLALRDLFEDRAAGAEELAHLDELAGLATIASSHRDRAAKLRAYADKFASVSLLTLAFGALPL